jgi:hypothetical protein
MTVKQQLLAAGKFWEARANGVFHSPPNNGFAGHSQVSQDLQNDEVTPNLFCMLPDFRDLNPDRSGPVLPSEAMPATGPVSAVPAGRSNADRIANPSRPFATIDFSSGTDTATRPGDTGHSNRPF